MLDPKALESKRIEGLTHVLLDIEGTTCPVSFVSEVLFPYAAAHLESFLASNQHVTVVRELVAEVEQAWREDGQARAAGLPWQSGLPVAPYLLWLIEQDRKLTALKELQGLIWQQGYASGELKGPLFNDVPPALRRWQRDGVRLAVYSSGSVSAQQLLYGHSQVGDLRTLFSHWFDTRIGAKHESRSYDLISEQMGCDPRSILFISDSNRELQAARSAGMQVLFSDRDGNPNRDAAGFERMSTFSTLQLSP
ncbi:MAG: acireductone synthase [Cyanobacteria bacterium K_DeepCast_35m_m2_023]|nr:acireductone synthase [Cyanobacteria bacterium K_DeepCast_35m_m2_023]